ncbi:MAG: protein kinase [Kofleriaceae bacterium]
MTCTGCGQVNPAEARFCARCGLAVVSTAAATPRSGPSRPPELVGREIAGRYRLLAKLGEGGMGAVYRAEQLSLKRPIAVKLLRPEMSADAGLVRRFNAEAELAAKLSHPNTVAVFDFGQDTDGTLFIAMELVDGTSLRAELQRGPMPVARVLAIAQQIAASLADAHARGIVHRDLKPDNVMLSQRGRQVDVVRVLDFGIAKLRDDGRTTQQQMTQAGDMLGTPQYMAPEQIRAEPVDGRTDVYALGAIVYEMLTGRLAFEGPTVMAILSKHLTEAPTAPSARRTDVAIPPPLDALVLRALAKDPAQRPATMEAFADELAAAAGALPTQPTPMVAVGGGASAASTPAPITPGPPRVPLAPTSPHVSTPATTPASAVATYVTPRRSRAPYLALAVLAVGGIVAGVVISIRSQATPAAPAKDDPWTTPAGSSTGSAAGPVAAGSARPATPALAGSALRSTSGWGVVFPPGYTVAGEGTAIGGKVGDTEAILCNDVTDVAYDLDALVASFVKESGMEVVPGTASMEEVLGARRPHAIFRNAQAAAEAVTYHGPGYYFACAYFGSHAVFEQRTAMRIELFTQRVQLPAATP